MKKLLTIVTACILGGTSTIALAQEEAAAEDPAITTAEEAVSLDDLRDMVESGRITETESHKAREAEFERQRAQQQQLLRRTEQERDREQDKATRLEAQIQQNEQRIDALTQTLNERKGQLNEVFGTLQQFAGDLRSVIQGSHISLQFPNREDGINTLIAKSSEGTELPTIEEIEELWKQMILEMTESGKIVRFNHDVVTTDGNRETAEVVRVGDFNIVSDGKYLRVDIQEGQIQELAAQPSGRFTSTVDDLESATDGIVTFAVDPSRGGVLSILVQAPSLQDRWHQGREVGYLISFLGGIAILLTIWRFVILLSAGRKVNAQIRNETPDAGNALGRVLMVYHENKDVDVETLELKLDEAILKETPALEAYLGLIKLISAVAPLLGLLGTVTGMIATFQSITLFGTGDPKLMAGGISQALVTTVLGLIVAIPTLLMHSFVSSMSRRVIHVLEEQSAGLIAVHAEKEHGNVRTA
ncbi:MAG: MotA/TolQ/ExbB proton channel family protein [Sphingomonadales bacterium]|nr:MotA/TolQ/ExbB proton channel family protein [Sphingomonadales bacterium]